MARIDFGGNRIISKEPRQAPAIKNAELPDEMLGAALLFADDLHSVLGEFTLYLYGGFATGRHRSTSPDVDVYVKKSHLSQTDKIKIRRIALKYPIIDCVMGDNPPQPNKILIDYALD